jgi:hypothetical protein
VTILKGDFQVFFRFFPGDRYIDYRPHTGVAPAPSPVVCARSPHSSPVNPKPETLNGIYSPPGARPIIPRRTGHFGPFFTTSAHVCTTKQWLPGRSGFTYISISTTSLPLYFGLFSSQLLCTSPASAEQKNQFAISANVCFSRRPKSSFPAANGLMTVFWHIRQLLGSSERASFTFIDFRTYRTRSGRRWCGCGRCIWQIYCLRDSS